MKLDPDLEAKILARCDGEPNRKSKIQNPKSIGSSLEAAFENLWKLLGNAQEPRREYAFAQDDGRRWRFDFAWPEKLLAVELEGIFRFGDQTRHQRAAGYANDVEKYNAAVKLGWRVLRFTQDDLRKKPFETIELVKRVLEGGLRAGD